MDSYLAPFRPNEPCRADALPVRKAWARVAPPSATMAFDAVRLKLRPPPPPSRVPLKRELHKLSPDRGLVDTVGSFYGRPLLAKRVRGPSVIDDDEDDTPRTVKRAARASVPRAALAKRTLALEDVVVLALPEVGDPSGMRERRDTLVLDPTIDLECGGGE